MLLTEYLFTSLIPTVIKFILMQTKSSATRGFTLIELLVVIAIIGILSSVVLASLNTARQKGSDAAVKSNIATIRTQAALDYSSNGNSYGASALKVLTSTVNQTGSPGTAVAVFGAGAVGDSTVGNSLIQLYTNSSGHIGKYGSNGTAYVVAAKLSINKYWCADSIDYTGIVTALPTTFKCK